MIVIDLHVGNERIVSQRNDPSTFRGAPLLGFSPEGLLSEISAMVAAREVRPTAINFNDRRPS